MINFLKKFIYKTYVIFLMAFTVWYGHFMYPLIFGFEGKEGAEISLKKLGDAGTDEEKAFIKLISEQSRSKKTDLGYKLIDQPYIEGRFHHIRFNIQRDNGSICIRCHGNIPHDKSKEIRSFLNMHTFYLACETCHATPEKGAPEWGFSWYDKETGAVTDNPPALLEMSEDYRSKKDIAKFTSYGNYGAKIAPMKLESGQYRLLNDVKQMAFIDRYFSELDKLRPEKRSQMRAVLHRLVNKEPIQCDSCHQQDKPYINFSTLGYPETRMRELTNLAVIGILKKYQQFQIPEFFKADKKEM